MLEKPRKALIVDDESDVRLFVKSILEGEGWLTVEAADGEEAVDLAASEEPSLIVMDVMMPNMDGFEAFRRIRSNEFTKLIPIIMLTGINEFKEGVQHSEATMETELNVRAPEGFVDKPVDPRFLLYTLQGVVG